MTFDPARPHHFNRDGRCPCGDQLHPADAAATEAIGLNGWVRCAGCISIIKTQQSHRGVNRTPYSKKARADGFMNVPADYTDDERRGTDGRRIGLRGNRSGRARGKTQNREGAKPVSYRERCKAEGQCPHCGKPCAPYYECEERRAYARNRRRDRVQEQLAAEAPTL